MGWVCNRPQSPILFLHFISNLPKTCHVLFVKHCNSHTFLRMRTAMLCWKHTSWSSALLQPVCHCFMLCDCERALACQQVAELWATYYHWWQLHDSPCLHSEWACHRCSFVVWKAYSSLHQKHAEPTVQQGAEPHQDLWLGQYVLGAAHVMTGKVLPIQWQVSILTVLQLRQHFMQQEMQIIGSFRTGQIRQTLLQREVFKDVNQDAKFLEAKEALWQSHSYRPLQGMWVRRLDLLFFWWLDYILPLIYVLNVHICIIYIQISIRIEFNV